MNEKIIVCHRCNKPFQDVLYKPEYKATRLYCNSCINILWEEKKAKELKNRRFIERFYLMMRKLKQIN